MSTSARVVFRWLHSYQLYKQAASYDLSHNWLMRLTMDLAALYGMWTCNLHQLSPLDSYDF